MAALAAAPAPADAYEPRPLPFGNGTVAPSASGAVTGALLAAVLPQGDESCFECNVCLELASDPVVTVCGHLFCWPCLYRWLALNQDCKTCPVCKAGVDEEKVVPLYGRGGNGKDPRKHPVDGVPIPSRPAAQRPPVQLAYGAGRAQAAGGGLGFGIVPSVFGLTAGGNGAHAGMMYGEPLSPEQQQQAFLSRLLLMLGSFVIMCLLLF